MGNLSLREIDQLIGILLERKRRGHFSGFWKTAADSVRLMQDGIAGAQSIWAPALTTLAAEGMPVIELAPREGYRAWHGGMCLARHLKGRMLDAAYDYLNWWLSGWPGAVMARQGYYMAASWRVRDWLSAPEWDWASPQPATCPAPMAASSCAPENCAPAAPTGAKPAASPSGTRPWTNTTTWPDAGKTSSPIPPWLRQYLYRIHVAAHQPPTPGRVDSGGPNRAGYRSCG